MGCPRRLGAVLDTGAQWTELSDNFLLHVGLLDAIPPGISVASDQQTRKYGRLVIPEMRICGQVLTDLEIRVSRFEETWDIDALIGLDFFRHFPVTIDYHRGVLEVG